MTSEDSDSDDEETSGITSVPVVSQIINGSCLSMSSACKLVGRLPIGGHARVRMTILRRTREILVGAIADLDVAISLTKRELKE